MESAQVTQDHELLPKDLEQLVKDYKASFRTTTAAATTATVGDCFRRMWCWRHYLGSSSFWNPYIPITPGPPILKTVTRACRRLGSVLFVDFGFCLPYTGPVPGSCCTALDHGRPAFTCSSGRSFRRSWGQFWLLGFGFRAIELSFTIWVGWGWNLTVAPVTEKLLVRSFDPKMLTCKKSQIHEAVN